MSDMRPRLVPREYLWPFILLVIPFALWGIANNMTDLVVPTFKNVMDMSQEESSWIQFVFYGAYFLLALPAAFFIQRFSYKSGVLLGLVVFALGTILCYPAMWTQEFGPFLLALLVFASGCAILETTVAPFVLAMGPVETATRRINLAQSFNPAGSVLGILIGQQVILKHLSTPESRASMDEVTKQATLNADLGHVVNAYAICGLIGIALAVAIFVKRFPDMRDTKGFGSVGATARRLVTNPLYLSAVAAQFLYVGMQIGVMTFAIRYVVENHPEINNDADAANLPLLGMSLFFVARLTCTGLMRWIQPAVLLGIISVIAMGLCAGIVYAGGLTGCYCIVALYACMSLMFPTIYGLGLTGMREDAKLGGAGIIMAIVGGAILVPRQARVIDVEGSANPSFQFQLMGFALILVFSVFAGWAARKKLAATGSVPLT